MWKPIKNMYSVTIQVLLVSDRSICMDFIPATLVFLIPFDFCISLNLLHTISTDMQTHDSCRRCRAKLNVLPTTQHTNTKTNRTTQWFHFNKPMSQHHFHTLQISQKEESISFRFCDFDLPVISISWFPDISCNSALARGRLFTRQESRWRCQ